jgi:3-deoxy-D-manno-octulosonic-acid transferase
MIKYEDIIRKIKNLENKKSKNEEKIKSLSQDNISIISNLKILNQKKEQLEKMDHELSDIIPLKKKDIAK